ncbi:hypothetical protein SUGI_0505340 [Cryptomeria japonica]|nr:hypothetical protein SUGI_0505340 [Cryptomeria japonica]
MLDWESNINPSTHCPTRFPHWVSLGNLPPEYWSTKVIDKTGNSLGKVIRYKEEFYLGRSRMVKISIDLDMNFRYLDKLEILTNKGSWYERIVVEST